jgi:hypothetical protein
MQTPTVSIEVVLVGLCNAVGRDFAPTLPTLSVPFHGAGCSNYSSGLQLMGVSDGTQLDGSHWCIARYNHLKRVER